MARKSINQLLGIRMLHAGTETAAFDLDTKLDVTGYNGICMVVTHDGTASSATYAVTLKHCDTEDGTFENVPADEISCDSLNASGVPFLAAGGASLKVGYLGIKRYVTANITPTSATGTTVVMGILGEATYNPTN